MSDQPNENGLARRLGLFPLTNIVIANMIGAGIFTTSGLLMGDLHNPLIMIMLWITGGGIALCGALSYGELGAAMPRAGGEYTFLSRLYHPIFGFLTGWVSLFAGFSAPIAASAIGFSEYLARAFPGLLTPGVFDGATEAVVMKKLYAIAVIIAFTLIHMRGLELGTLIQNLLTILKVGLVLAFIVVGLSLGKGDMGHLLQGDDFTFDFAGWKTIGLSLMWIMYAYAGWNASAYIGAEINNPSRNLPRSLILGTSLVLVLYLGLNLVYIYATSPQAMEGVISIGGLAVGNMFGPSFERIVSITISFALFSSLSAYIILGPRVYYSMSRDKLFFRFAADIHSRFRVPSRSIFLQGIIAVVMVLLGSFDQILTYMGFSLGIFPILAVIGVFKVRRRKLSPYKLPGFPYVPLIYISSGILILFLAFFERPTESSIAIATVAIGVPVYWMFKKIYE